LNAQKSIFLAGTTSPTGEPDWRETLTEALLGLSITINNPKRDDWDSTWKEDFSDHRWAEQVEWELEMQDKADVIVVFFHGISPAPISLLELGLCVRSGKAIVCALQGYSKRGNVEAVCRRYGAKFVSSEQDLKDAVMERLG
jgi:membrane glycosyltransferase